MQNVLPARVRVETSVITSTFRDTSGSSVWSGSGPRGRAGASAPSSRSAQDSSSSNTWERWLASRSSGEAPPPPPPFVPPSSDWSAPSGFQEPHDGAVLLPQRPLLSEPGQRHGDRQLPDGQRGALHQPQLWAQLWDAEMVGVWGAVNAQPAEPVSNVCWAFNCYFKPEKCLHPSALWRFVCLTNCDFLMFLWCKKQMNYI